jgi:cellulose synthase/poly-beta-1,6-N-acetylglucosamine synthase-like glycosyltransferase
VRAARYPLIAQIDQDVVVGPGWFARLTAELDDPRVAAAQGYYLSASDAGLFARVMNLDLEQRYAGIEGSATDHVCTGNTMYRADALHRVGLFDESQLAMTTTLPTAWRRRVSTGSTIRARYR